MTTDLSIDIRPAELSQIVAAVFATMLSLETEICAAPWSGGSDRVTSAVHLSGDWNGAVLFECNRNQARLFAGRFLSMDPPGTVEDVVRDVLGELANMIGGNLKCILSTQIRLSMPAVVEGSDYSLRVCGAEVRSRLTFRCSEGLFQVTVLATRA